MSDQESRYTGLTSFLASLLSVGTGLVYSVMVTRRLALTEYGVWQYYSVIITLLSLPSSIIGFWLTRELGRGNSVVHTGLSVSGLLSTLASVILVAVSFFQDPTLHVGLEVLLALALCLILTYLSNSLDATVSGVAPRLFGPGRLVLEVVKVSAGVVLVVLLRMGLLGAVLSIDIAFALKCLYVYLAVPRNKVGTVEISKGLLWLKRWWVPSIAAAPVLVSSMDLLVLTWLADSTVPTAYLALSKTVSAIVGFSGLMAISLYPQLLGGGTRRNIEESIRLVFIFALPMTAGIVALALPIVHLFGSNYAPAATALQLLSLSAFFAVLRDLSVTIILGTEQVDNKSDVSAADLARSGLVVPHAIEIVGYLLYIAIVTAAVSLIGMKGLSLEHLTTVTALVNVLVTIPMSLLVWRLSKRSCQYRTPWGDIAKYATATVAMLAVVLALYPSQAISVSISDVTSGLLPVVAVGGAVYFVVLFCIDRRVREDAEEIYRHFFGQRGKSLGLSEA